MLRTIQAFTDLLQGFWITKPFSQHAHLWRLRRRRQYGIQIVQRPRDLDRLCRAPTTTTLPTSKCTFILFTIIINTLVRNRLNANRKNSQPGDFKRSTTLPKLTIALLSISCSYGEIFLITRPLQWTWHART